MSIMENNPFIELPADGGIEFRRLLSQHGLEYQSVAVLSNNGPLLIALAKSLSDPETWSSFFAAIAVWLKGKSARQATFSFRDEHGRAYRESYQGYSADEICKIHKVIAHIWLEERAGVKEAETENKPQ